MPPILALLLWFALLLALLRFDPAKEPGVSTALWLPVIWFFIVGSRLPSQWVGEVGQRAVENMEQGNALDRSIYSLLILLAFGILISRSFEWKKLFVANAALTAFLSFALLSVLWSDFPFIAFKRWFRDLGFYLMILVALSDPRPSEAVRTLLRRLCFLLIPLCILLNKYFPEMSKEYDQWTGQGYFIGATTSKNMLGLLCVVSGLFFFWDVLTRWDNRRERRTRWIIRVNLALLAMTLWLLSMAGSATSSVCFALGCSVIAAAHNGTIKRHPAILTALIPVGICLYLLLQFGFGMDILAALAEAIGRNPDLTGRTHIWSVVLGTNTDPVVGTGYESFWLGPRLRWVWERAGGVNEAHNGYLEVYLNLGLVGLCLLAGFLIASYRTVCRRFRAAASLGSLSLALWTTLLFYNVTESAFSGQLLWIVFLLGVIVVPGRSKRSPANQTSIEESPSNVWKGRTTPNPRGPALSCCQLDQTRRNDDASACCAAWGTDWNSLLGII
jgi:exopolysaccharide production protein ExoQ